MSSLRHALLSTKDIEKTHQRVILSYLFGGSHAFTNPYEPDESILSYGTPQRSQYSIERTLALVAQALGAVEEIQDSHPGLLTRRRPRSLVAGEDAATLFSQEEINYMRRVFSRKHVRQGAPDSVLEPAGGAQFGNGSALSAICLGLLPLAEGVIASLSYFQARESCPDPADWVVSAIIATLTRRITAPNLNVPVSGAGVFSLAGEVLESIAPVLLSISNNEEGSAQVSLVSTQHRVQQIITRTGFMLSYYATMWGSLADALLSPHGAQRDLCSVFGAGYESDEVLYCSLGVLALYGGNSPGGFMEGINHMAHLSGNKEGLSACGAAFLASALRCDETSVKSFANRHTGFFDTVEAVSSLRAKLTT